ncbi:MAG: formyl transferase protein [Rhizobium sp.]|nr:formyl transferase protein [Rhizobium sp.]
MRIALVGTVEGTEIAFKSLVEAQRPPILLVTLPLEAAGRHSDFADLTTPARNLGIEVHNTTNINSLETIKVMTDSKPDLTLVLGWSQICRLPFRDIAKTGTVGFHPAALPRLRGRGVIPWTILRNEPTTGSTLFWLDEGVDSGDILLQRLFPLDSAETARSLYDKHTRNMREMVPEAVSLIENGVSTRLIQDESEASYCAKRTPEDGLIDWHASAASILRLIRAVGDPYPGSFTCQDGERIRIDEAVSVPHSERFIGIVGQVQVHTALGFIVLCGDGECIEVRKWHSAFSRKPHIHSKLK